MNKIKTLALATLLISSTSFAANTKPFLSVGKPRVNPGVLSLREVNKGKNAELKLLKLQLKQLKDQEQAQRLQERSQKLDEQIAMAKAKLADARGLK